MTTTHTAKIHTATLANVAAPKGDPGGSVQGAVRLFLHTYAAGACVTCGQDTLLDAPSSDPRQATIGHIASVGNSKRGIVPGAVANQCRACQDAQGNASLLPYLTATMAARVPVAFPAKSELMRAYAASKSDETSDYAASAYAARVAAGLPW